MYNAKNFFLMFVGAIAIVSCASYDDQQVVMMPDSSNGGIIGRAEADIPVYSNRSDHTNQQSFSQDTKTSGESSFPSGNGMKKWSQEDKYSSFHKETKSSSSTGHFNIGIEGG